MTTPQVSTRRRILIADDDENSRSLVGIALDNSDFELVYALDGNQAKELLSSESFDLAILDIQMPGPSGMALCAWLKEEKPDVFTPVLLLTSFTELQDKVSGLECGADDYITKPFALPELLARVHAFLRIKDLTERLRETQNLLAEKEKELITVQVAGAAAHELGQPLTALLLNCELLSQLSSGNPELQETLRQTIEQVNEMRDILTRLQSVQQYKTKSYLKNTKILDL